MRINGRNAKPGDYFEISDEERVIGYALRLSDSHSFAIHKLIEGSPVPKVEDIQHLPVAFTVACSLKSRELIRWRFVGKEPNIALYERRIIYKVYDRFADTYEIYCEEPALESGSMRFPARKADADHLEALAIWYPEHVEQRLKTDDEAELLRRMGM